MLVGNSYTRFVIFLAKTIFEIRCWAAIMTSYEEFKTTTSRLVHTNELVHAFTDRVLIIMYSCQFMYLYINFLIIQL